MKPPRRTQTERREESERRLLEAALAIVAERGTVRMTLAEVAAAAGYSRGLPAHRFGSKAGLVHALAGYIGERFGQEREQQRAGGRALRPGLEAIIGNIDFYFRRAHPRRAAAAKAGGDAAAQAHSSASTEAFLAMRAMLVMMNESCMDPHSEHAALLRTEVAGYNRGALAWFEHHIRAGIAQGEIAAGTDPQATAVLLLGAMRGVMQQWLVDDRIRLGPVHRQLIAMVRLLLAPGRQA